LRTGKNHNIIPPFADVNYNLPLQAEEGESLLLCLHTAHCALSQTSCPLCTVSDVSTLYGVQQHQQRCNTRLPIAAVCLQQPACRLQAGAQHRHPSCTDCRFCAFRVRIVEVLRILAGKLALILHGARQYLQTDGAVSLSLLHLYARRFTF